MKVLVAESEPVTQAMICGGLKRWGHEVEIAGDQAAAWTALTHPRGPQIAVIAADLPNAGRQDLLADLKGLDRETWVLLRESSGGGLQRQAADDVLPFPFGLKLLRTRLDVAQRVLTTRQELRECKAALRKQARTDALTGVASRAVVLESLDRELARAKRMETLVSIIVVDIDGLRRVNDAFGNAAGDAALRQTAQRLSTGVRRYDVVGRSDGEEFLVVLPGCTAEHARQLAARIRLEIRGRTMPTPAGPVAITASFGVATTGQFDAQVLLAVANDGLAQAKHAGGDQIAGD
ncbi:MAG: diguanylate cyclase [Myxococcales bacterium]|nr:diguanylate cyclase [Myxococcales bacterium]